MQSCQEKMSFRPASCLHYTTKIYFRISGPRRRWPALTAMRGVRSKRNYRGSDYFVRCCARALSLLCPPCPLQVGTMHQTIGFFRRLNWATSPRAGWRCAPLHARAASGTLLGRAEGRVLPVNNGIGAVAYVLRGQTPRTRRRGQSLAYALRGRKMPPAGSRQRCASIPERHGASAPPTQQWLALLR